MLQERQFAALEYRCGQNLQVMNAIFLAASSRRSPFSKS